MVPDCLYLEGQLVQSDLPRGPLHHASRLSPSARVLRVCDTPSTRLRAMPPAAMISADKRYTIAHTVSGNATARRDSLVGEGPLKISDGHFFVKVLPPKEVPPRGGGENDWTMCVKRSFCSWSI